jgi:hypothetical protein
MRRFLTTRRPSPAMAVAFVALLAALSGTAVALPGKNTVDSGDIKKGAVKSQDIKDGGVTTKDTKNNTLTGTDINEAKLGKVPQAAAADALGNVDYNSATVANPAGQNTPGTVSCDPGQRVVGGGIKADDIVNQVLVDSYPRGTDGWSGTVFNGGTGTVNFTIFAICTSSTGTS